MNVVGLHFATRNMTLVRAYSILLYNQMASEMKEWVQPPDLMCSYSHNIKYLLKRGQNTLQSSHLSIDNGVPRSRMLLYLHLILK
jgi:hypothetical protein